MKTIILCHRPGCGSCPELHVSDNLSTYCITDDYGGVVTLTKDEMQKLSEQITIMLQQKQEI